MNQFAHIKFFVNTSGRKDFPFVAMSCGGQCLGYFKDSKTAANFLKGMQAC